MQEYHDYCIAIDEHFRRLFEVAKAARMKNFDPRPEPESMVALDLAERVEKSVGPQGVSERIRMYLRKLPREEVAFKIAEEIVHGKYGHEGEDAADQAIRTGLSILDEGVTVAPIQGIVKSVIKSNPDQSKYLAVYFAGPIRSAGGTEMAMILVLAEFIRQLMGLSRYKATEDEAKRFVEELRLYEKEVARFQYKFSDDELYDAIMNLPVEATGIETDQIEVTTYRNLSRIETNCVRGGALRVVNDGLLGRSNKVLKLVEKLGISGWEWLKKIRPQNIEKEDIRRFMFMEEVIAGRPIFSFPSVQGGFRLRYGRSRNTGLSSIGIHPATMEILNNFIAAGTQLKLEKPGKGGIVNPVDYIEPPIIKIANGSVVKVEDIDQAKKLKKEMVKILFLGDILVGFGEFVENNKPLIPSGYTEEWWSEHLRVAFSKFKNNLQDIKEKIGLEEERIKFFISSPIIDKPSATEALALARALNIPLHPKFTYFWENITISEFNKLRNHLRKAELSFNKGSIEKIQMSSEVDSKETLEKICIPHRVSESNIIIEGEDALIIWECLKPTEDASYWESADIFELIKNIAGLNVYRKGGTYIGTRMGRPEKAKEREMKPLVNSLFPVGLAGGSKRNIIEAVNKKMISVEIANRKCSICGKDLVSNYCKDCNVPAILVKVCPFCRKELTEESCQICKAKPVKFKRTYINISEIFQEGLNRLGIVKPPNLIKGIKGLSNEDKIPEPIEKGILRAIYSLSVFKDGTIRFDSTNAVLTHFKSSEIGVPVKRLRELGYNYDHNGCPLMEKDQIIPIKLQDIVISKKCGEYLVKVSKFIDDLLIRFYRTGPFYNIKDHEDLVGHLVVGLSPHTSVGVIGRIIGFTENNVCYAHPFWHAAKRRDCDGDEDSISLLLDVLLNFSRSFLPKRIGGMMDAPLLITLLINPSEVARQAFNIETSQRLPLKFFEETQIGADPRKVCQLIEMISHRLNTPLQFEQIGYTHPVNNINRANHESSYKKFTSMFEKLEGQLSLAEMIKAVQADVVAQKVVATHFMRDIIGNLRAYSSQKIRCKKCNMKYRRIPLSKKCIRCGGEISLTVFRGTIEKYLEAARRLVKRYRLGLYQEQRINLIEAEINRLFKGRKVIEQKALADFM